jgi:hypothetical protein
MVLSLVSQAIEIPTQTPDRAGEVKTYRVGTLTYTKAGLLVVGAWLLSGGFLPDTDGSGCAQHHPRQTQIARRVRLGHRLDRLNHSQRDGHGDGALHQLQERPPSRSLGTAHSVHRLDAAYILLPLSIGAWIYWHWVEHQIRLDVRRARSDQPLHNGIPHHGVLIVAAIQALMTLGLWVVQVVLSIRYRQPTAAIAFGA